MPIAQALGVVMGVLLTVLNVFTSVFNVTMKYWTVAGPVLIALTTIIGTLQWWGNTFKHVKD